MEGYDMWLFKSHATDADVRAVREVLERGTWWIDGPEIEAFQSQIAEITDREYGMAVDSGTSALLAILETIGVEGQNVVVPSFTYPATANAVVSAGGTPVFADIEPETLSLRAEDVREKIDDDTAAVIVVHFSGNVSKEIAELQEITADHGIPLVEDAAHSLGAARDGDAVGSFGTAGAFSFSFNKLVTTGEGGMVVTDDEEMRASVGRLRNQGRNDRREYVEHGYNLTMSSIAAAIGRSQVRRIDEIRRERREMAAYLNDRLGELRSVSVPTDRLDRGRVYLYYNLMAADHETREALREHLESAGIPTQITYEPVHLTEYYRSAFGCEPGTLPVTEDISRRILTLPFHLELSPEQLDTIAAAVEAFDGRVAA